MTMTANNRNPEAVRRHTKRLGRELAMQFLFGCEMRGETPGAAAFDLFFESVRDEVNLPDGRLARKGREYAAALYAAVELRREEIDAIIKPHCRNWDWDRVAAVDRNILRVAVAELLAYPELPLLVPIDEAVEIARDFSGEEGGRFVNGVLNSLKDEVEKMRRKA